MTSDHSFVKSWIGNRTNISYSDFEVQNVVLSEDGSLYRRGRMGGGGGGGLAACLNRA